MRGEITDRPKRCSKKCQLFHSFSCEEPEDNEGAEIQCLREKEKIQELKIGEKGRKRNGTGSACEEEKRREKRREK
ncbi:hypothetical protein L1S32_09400 [Methanogenium sp. S4BF]|uniref:hypothetical protein n=1 Tax=Methanogenium sp. S4BF TaxID=1789226 RepID=UPI002417DEBA|nr:hypothetical protein [Methanogenium sp. S4BF]WFN34057.1 hypothetical protein L1S32_09400 [Methanogenium sp. S4BF]